VNVKGIGSAAAAPGVSSGLVGVVFIEPDGRPLRLPPLPAFIQAGGLPLRLTPPRASGSNARIAASIWPSSSSMISAFL